MARCEERAIEGVFAIAMYPLPAKRGGVGPMFSVARRNEARRLYSNSIASEKDFPLAKFEAGATPVLNRATRKETLRADPGVGARSVSTRNFRWTEYTGPQLVEKKLQSDPPAWS